MKNLESFEQSTYYRTQMTPSPITIHVGEKGVIRIDFLIADLREVVPKLQGEFDLIFHDPFSPQKAPELWSADLFAEYHRLLAKPHGRLLTYSAAGAVRGGLREAGFTVGRTEGVGSKSSATIAGFGAGFFANVPLGAAQPLTADEKVFLTTKAGIPYRDPTFSDSSDQVKARRAEEQAASCLPSASALRKAPFL